MFVICIDRFSNALTLYFPSKVHLAKEKYRALKIKTMAKEHSSVDLDESLRVVEAPETPRRRVSTYPPSSTDTFRAQIIMFISGYKHPTFVPTCLDHSSWQSLRTGSRFSVLFQEICRMKLNTTPRTDSLLIGNFRSRDENWNGYPKSRQYHSRSTWTGKATRKLQYNLGRGGEGCSGSVDSNRVPHRRSLTTGRLQGSLHRPRVSSALPWIAVYCRIIVVYNSDVHINLNNFANACSQQRHGTGI